MNLSRRNFFKISGIWAMGLGFLPILQTVASSELSSSKFSPGKDQLTGNSWAMVIDLNKCQNDCRDCVKACHGIHNVPAIDNPKEEVKWLWLQPYPKALPNLEHKYLDNRNKTKAVPVLCNHCEKPACVRVCPTKATFKRNNGIIAMDYHRCIGCRYCMAACPYGARSFNFKEPAPYISELNQAFPMRTKGVVEKCNFCEERLAQGQLPACVDSCKNEALFFGDLADPNSVVRKLLGERLSVQRKPEYGAKPSVYYLV